MTTPTFLHALTETLGAAGAQRFLVFALPQIRQARHDLLIFLREQDWEAAAAIAHRLKATAHLYSTHALQESIATILARDPDQLRQQAFQAQLEAEFMHIENTIATWLDNK